jgi:hypothetical protein
MSETDGFRNKLEDLADALKARLKATSDHVARDLITDAIKDLNDQFAELDQVELAEAARGVGNIMDTLQTDLKAAQAGVFDSTLSAAVDAISGTRTAAPPPAGASAPSPTRMPIQAAASAVRPTPTASMPPGDQAPSPPAVVVPVTPSSSSTSPPTPLVTSIPASASALIGAAVGAAPAPNQPKDVRIVRYLMSIIVEGTPISAVCDPQLLDGIRKFQSARAAVTNPDGRIDPGGRTLRALVDQAAQLRPARQDLGTFPAAMPVAALAADGSNVQAWVDQTLAVVARSILSDADFAAAAASLGAGIPGALIHAFAEVESGGRSGFDASGRPVIAYEGHVFRRYTNNRFDASHPLLSYPYKQKAGPEWQINNANPDTSWKTLEAAMALDHSAALQAVSWGAFQVMGFNFAACGYPKVDAFVDAIKSSARGQLQAFVGFCKSTGGMLAAMARRDFQGMATLYNGEDFGDYDQRIQKAFEKYGGG